MKRILHTIILFLLISPFARAQGWGLEAGPCWSVIKTNLNDSISGAPGISLGVVSNFFDPESLHMFIDYVLSLHGFHATVYQSDPASNTGNLIVGPEERFNLLDLAGAIGVAYPVVYPSLEIAAGLYSSISFTTGKTFRDPNEQYFLSKKYDIPLVYFADEGENPVYGFFLQMDGGTEDLRLQLRYLIPINERLTDFYNLYYFSDRELSLRLIWYFSLY